MVFLMIGGDNNEKKINANNFQPQGYLYIDGTEVSNTAPTFLPKGLEYKIVNLREEKNRRHESSLIIYD